MFFTFPHTVCVCGKSAEICGYVCADLRRDTCSKINIVMDHEMCLTWYSVGAKGLGDANSHRNRETLVHFKKGAKMSNFDHKSPSYQSSDSQQGWQRSQAVIW